MDKNLWVIDDESAEVVRKIFRLCIDGYGPSQIARILTQEGIPTPTAYALRRAGIMVIRMPSRIAGAAKRLPIFSKRLSIADTL